MIKFIFALALISVAPLSYAGECSSGKCHSRSRVVTTTREVVAIPFKITRKVVASTRTIGGRTVSRVRNIVR